MPFDKSVSTAELLIVISRTFGFRQSKLENVNFGMLLPQDQCSKKQLNA